VGGVGLTGWKGASVSAAAEEALFTIAATPTAASSTLQKSPLLTFW
jgi:hypothetical protein